MLAGWAVLMYMMYMVRKQLYIDAKQDRALKRRAKALGVSEAELVRRALDTLLLGDTISGPLPYHEVGLRALLEDAQASATRHRLPAGTKLDRAALYAEREGRVAPVRR